MSTGIELPPPPPPLPEDGGRLTIPDAEFSVSIPDSQERACPNCGAPVHGPFCYACGQSEKGMIRHLSEVLSDLADIVLNVDSRIFRSLWDLYIRPGYLTTEYLAGRRARYVTPFRLFFFLTIIAFFAMQASIDPEDFTDGIASASTPEEVINIVDGKIATLMLTRNVPGVDAEAKEEIDSKIQELREDRSARLLELGLEGAQSPEQIVKAVDDAVVSMTAAKDSPGASTKTKARLDRQLAKARAEGDIRLIELKEDAQRLAEGRPLPKRKKKSGVIFGLEDDPWDPEASPIAVDWLPDSLNKRLNNTVKHMKENLDGLQKNPEKLMVAWFSVLPQTLFVVMPLFAVLLKIFYLFKRRLYMEHLLVALHSHAFIFMSVLVILFLSMLAGLVENSPILREVIEWLRAAAWWWLFAYLLIMQKRVYRQGWFITVLKYCAIGLCYTIFLSFALGLAALIALAIT